MSPDAVKNEDLAEHTRSSWNACRLEPDSDRGHYESYFQRANHPERPLAFWIRYTLLSPKGRPDDRVGELWAIWFDGDEGEVTAVKEVVAWNQCRFSRGSLDARVADATLSQDALSGEASSCGHRIGWSLGYSSPQPHLLLLPSFAYAGPFPKARALVGSPNAVFDGEVVVDGKAHAIDGWVGSQNHNWGEKHTDQYAWGQVAGFDGRPGSFLECGSGRVKLGPIWTPWLTVMVLRLDGVDHQLNSPRTALRARSRFDFFTFDFESSNREVSVSGQIAAPAETFIALPYDNPPGGRKTCLNSKLARCQLTVRRPNMPPTTLVSAERAAFEILTDESDHGVPVVPI